MTAERAELHPRKGLEIDQERMGTELFWKNAKFLLQVRDRMNNPEASEDDLKGMIIENLRNYCGLPSCEEDGSDPKKDYETYEACIAASTKELASYAEAMLVGDIAQRTGLTNELTGVMDPAELTDILVTTDDQRVRFEARRALHLGALFFEFEKRYGTEREILKTLQAIEIYLDAMILTPGKEIDAILYHKIKDEPSGRIIPSSIRIPAFGGGQNRRKPGENKVMLTFREALSDDSAKRPIHVVEKERVKSRFSALLKAIRSKRPIGSLKDVIALACYVDNAETELEDFVALLDTHFTSDPQDRDKHRLFGGEEEHENGHSAKEFSMEKLIVEWDTQMLLDNRIAVDMALSHFFGTKRNQDAFWQRAEEMAGKKIPIELQVGTLRDLVDNSLSGGDANHAIYKARQAGDVFEGDARNVLEMLFPQDLYGINFRSQVIYEALKQKQLAGLGLNKDILERFIED
ncbi:MAG: hypothetical protein Q8P90_03540 [bacterium]|nr:hypothetical protein [bacterium]